MTQTLMDFMMLEASKLAFSRYGNYPRGAKIKLLYSC